MVSKTKAQLAIFNALVKLIKMKPLNRIEVTEIVEVANVSRPTFYLYYREKSDLVNQFENYLLSKFEARGNKELSEAIKLTSHEASSEVIYPVFLRMMQTIEANFNSYKALLGQNGDPNFSSQIESEFVQILFGTLDEDSENMEFYQGIPVDYVMRIFFSDIMAIIQHWVTKPNPESSAKVAEIITMSRFTLPSDLIKRSN